MDNKFVGVDGEMTGDNLSEGHALCQAGFAVLPDRVFCDIINPVNYGWQTAAMAVHGITHGQIAKGKYDYEVDAEAIAFLNSTGRENRLIAVGWNVAGFDMPFFRKYLPAVMQLFSRRTIDLNAVCFAVSDSTRNPFKSLKKRSKRYAAEKIGEANWHNAGYDALAALYSLEYLQGEIHAS